MLKCLSVMQYKKFVEIIIQTKNKNSEFAGHVRKNW